MTVMQSFLLGIMVTWIPSLIGVAWLSWRNTHPEHPLDQVDGLDC